MKVEIDSLEIYEQELLKVNGNTSGSLYPRPTDKVFIAYLRKHPEIAGLKCIQMWMRNK